MKRSSLHQTFIILSLLIITLTGCVTYKATEQEKDQLFLAMLQHIQDDTCNLDKSECRQKFIDWQNSDFGKDIIEHYEDMKHQLRALTPRVQQARDSAYCDSDCKNKAATFLQISQSSDVELLIQHDAIEKARGNIQ